MTRKKWQPVIFFYFFLLSIYAIFSYSLVHPSLVLTSWQPYQFLQNWLWQNIFNNKILLSLIYLSLILGLWICFFYLVKVLKSQKFNFKKHFFLFLFFSLPLLFSYNALSADVFNYIFNAKLMIHYQVDPHITQPWIINDEWLRFIQNANGLAPYGYVWTYLSFVPFSFYLPNLFGLESVKFVPTFFSFKLFMLIGLILTFVLISKFYKKIYNKNIPLEKMLWFFFNPLVLIELVGNGHNDVWMMLPSLLALYLIWPDKKIKKWWIYLISLILLLLSTQIKLASIVLLPIWFCLLVLNFAKKSKITIIQLIKQPVLQLFQNREVGLLNISALLLLVPLLTDRSWQFYPWYLTWALVFLPLINSKFVFSLLIGLSLSSMFRYIPWLLTNQYSDQVIFIQKMISWPLGIIFTVLFYWLYLRKKATRYSSRKTHNALI